MIKYNISEGFLKKDITIAPSLPPNSWRCSILNEKQDVIKSTIEPDPLITNMEYTDKINGEITLAGHKTVHRKEASIMVRTRYTEEMKYVLFEKSDSLANPYTSGLFPITKLQRDN